MAKTLTALTPRRPVENVKTEDEDGQRHRSLPPLSTLSSLHLFLLGNNRLDVDVAV